LIFEIVSNHNGVTYPIPVPSEGTEPQKFDDNAFVGLSEVKIFHESGGGRIYEIKTPVIAKVSSELTIRSFDRAVKHLTDGSGLMRPERGWNQQGMPFYSDGVAYTEKFDFGQNVAENVKNRYFVMLNKWYGGVAKITVNGKDAGHIGFTPWQCDVTKFVKSGVNEITVTVIGTPKNLLGPHHNGAMRGSAWPNAFWNAPQNGPPPGNNYDMIGYGLFEPFVVLEK
jgi:hypothetical protein